MKLERKSGVGTYYLQCSSLVRIVIVSAVPYVDMYIESERKKSEILNDLK
jgi:hypothetical protein